MYINRRKFLQLGFRSAVIISAGNAMQSFAAADFTMPRKEEVLLRFAIASDGHYGQPGTAFDEMHKEMVAWINAERANRGVDFTFINGDLLHDDPAMLPLVKQQWDMLAMPYHVSHGNHDRVNENVWEQTWNTRWHYAFEHGDTGFIVLNSADDSGKYICPDAGWTKEQLAKYDHKKQLFVFMHITPFNWTKAGLPCPELVNMFGSQKNLKAVFHGHDHDQDNVKEHENKYYFFDSHAGGNWGTPYRGYRIVEVLKTGAIVTYQMNPVLKTSVNNNRIV